MADRYTVRWADDGSAHIYKDGEQWSQSAFKPPGPIGELVLQALVDGLNGRAFKLTGTALDVAERWNAERIPALELHIDLQSYELLLRMMLEKGFDSVRIWQP